MSSGIELGNAYISINARTDAMAGQIKAALNDSAKAADRAGADLGKRMSASAGKSLAAGARNAGVNFGRGFTDGASSIGVGKLLAGWRSELTGGALRSMGALAGKTFAAGLTGAVGIGIAGAGMALTKGFQRLMTIDTAKFKLKGLGKSAEEIRDIVQTVTDSVTGTPFSLDEAFSTATQAIGANVKDLKRFMTDVSDAAGFAGVDISRMGLIFNQVLAKGKLTGEEMMQLMEAGLPAKSWIMESYRLTSDQFDKMQAKGQVTMDMLQKSIEEHAGGMSKKLGDTLAGSIDQMQTALARVGANFLSAVFGGESGDATEGMKDAVQRVTVYLNKLDEWIKAHRDDIRTFFLSAVDAAKGLAEAIGKILGYLKEHPDAIRAVATAFAAWEGIKFTGLLTALGDKGGGGILGKLGLILAAIEVIDRFTGSTSSGPVNAGPNFGQQGLDAAAGALIGGQLGGVPGALAGGLIGGSIGPATDILKGGTPAQNGVLPGAPNTANLPTVGGIPIPGLMPGTAGPNGSNKFAPSGNVQGGAESWRPAVRATLSAYGPQYGITNPKAWEDAMIRQIQTESGGDPNAINNWDSNAKAGHPSQGLLQFIPSTFAAHNITGGSFTDPMAQMAAFIPYVMSRYGVDKTGAPLHVGRGKGYSAGGAVDSVPALLAPGEHVLTTNDVKAMGGQGRVYAFRQALHAKTGGALEDLVKLGNVEPGKPPPGADFDSPGARKDPASGATPVMPDIGAGGTGIIPDPSWWGIRGNPGDIGWWGWWGGKVMGEDAWKVLDPSRVNRRGVQGFNSGVYDSGGWLQPGKTLVENNTGKPEAVFTDGQLQDMRTAGYLPAAAGNMGQAGDSTIAKAIGMGAEVINGLIDQAASAASTAVAAGIAAGSAGAGAPGGAQAGAAAAQFAIGLGTNAAKRGVTWGADMLGIGADMLLQQAMPFGMPRWLSTDPGAFMPNVDITGALGDLMTQGAAPAPQDGAPHGTADGAPPGISNLMESTQPRPAGWFGDSLRHGDAAGAPPGPDAGWRDSMNSLLSTELAQQPPAGGAQPTVKIDTVYAQDPAELSAQIAKRQQLAAMQYTGRPGP